MAKPQKDFWGQDGKALWEEDSVSPKTHTRGIIHHSLLEHFPWYGCFLKKVKKKKEKPSAFRHTHCPQRLNPPCPLSPELAGKLYHSQHGGNPANCHTMQPFQEARIIRMCGQPLLLCCFSSQIHLQMSVTAGLCVEKLVIMGTRRPGSRQRCQPPTAGTPLVSSSAPFPLAGPAHT